LNEYALEYGEAMAAVPPLPRHAASIQPAEVRTLLGPVARPLVLEIGANDGGDSRGLAAAFPEATIHCFECDPRALAKFRAQPQLPNVLLHAYAVGAYDGRSTFHTSGGTNPSVGQGDWDLSGSLRRPTGHKERYRWCTFDRTIEVEVRRLDSWLAEQKLPTVDFIWLDVQGGEADVFAGAPRTLRRTRFLYTEFNAWKKPLYEGDLTLEGTLAALGPAWRPLAVYEGYNLLLKNEDFVRSPAPDA
jgi:FkbM family methyltransferase